MLASARIIHPKLVHITTFISTLPRSVVTNFFVFFSSAFVVSDICIYRAGEGERKRLREREI